MQYKSQAVAKPYFIAAIGLFVGQIDRHVFAFLGELAVISPDESICQSPPYA